MAALAAAIQELRAEMKDRYDTAFIFRRRQDGWQRIEVHLDRTWRSHWDTLAEATEDAHRAQAMADEARWEQGMDAIAQQQEDRYWEEGSSAFQMQYQAELDAEAQALGWDPMAVGAFGPGYN